MSQVMSVFKPTRKGLSIMNKLLYILICSTLLFSSSDAEQGEIEYVIRPQFDWAGYFSEGLAAVKMGDRYGYINKQGQYAVTLNLTVQSLFQRAKLVIGMDILTSKDNMLSTCYLTVLGLFQKVWL